MVPRRRIGRKLLVASLGVASVSYVACGSTDLSSNTKDAGGDGIASDAPADNFVVGNLVGPADATIDRRPPPEDAPVDQLVANLVPPPFDAGLDGDAKD